MSSHHDTGHAEAHVHGGPRIYTQLLTALLLLTFFTVFVARHPFDNNTVNVIIALAVATLKASLVGLIFMHLKYDSKVNAIVIVAAFVFLGIFLGTVLTDVTTRSEFLPGTYGVTANPPLGGMSEAQARRPGGNVKGEGVPAQDKINPSDNAAPSLGEVKSDVKTPTAQEAVNPVGKGRPGVQTTISGEK